MRPSRAPAGTIPKPPFREGHLTDGTFTPGSSSGASSSSSIFGYVDSDNLFFQGPMPGFVDLVDDDGPAKAPKLSHPPKPSDCLDILRSSAMDHIRDDCSDYEILAIHANPHALPGTANLKVFCDALAAFRARSKDYSRAPHQIVVLAYHGTRDESSVEPILKTQIRPGPRNAHGRGAYLTLDINVAYDYAYDNSRVQSQRHIIVSALMLDEAKFIFRHSRPERYIVNSVLEGHLPLFHVVLGKRVKAPTARPHAHVSFQRFTKKGAPLLKRPNRFTPGNASTNKRNVGGSKKKIKILYMTLDGSVGTTTM